MLVAEIGRVPRRRATPADCSLPCCWETSVVGRHPQPLSVVATHTLTLRQDTLPSWLDVSDVTDAQDLPASAVPTSDTVVPEPAAQQFSVVAHEIELSQPVLSNCCRSPQVTPRRGRGPPPARRPAGQCRLPSRSSSRARLAGRKR